MNTKNKHWKILISKRGVKSYIRQSAKQVTRFMKNHNDKPWAVICLLKGAFYVYTTLVTYLPDNIYCAFIYPHSYGTGKNSEGEVKLDLCGNTLSSFSEYNVLLVDDVCDTGKTLQHLKQLFKENCCTCYTWVFMDKTSNHKPEYSPDFCAISNVPNDTFLVGCGLDYEGTMRNITCVYDAGR